ncbi:MAG: TIM barrel protein [Verrucomicrobiota bacterium]
MKRLLILIVSLSALVSLRAEVPANFAKGELIAWCIVPFDAAKRGPAERIEMLNELGLERYAYDWRAEHVPAFDAEIEAALAGGVEMFAFWRGHEEAYPLFRKHGIKPQIWQTLQSPKEGTQEENVNAAANRMEAAARKTGEEELAFGLYNHGGWGGQPENLIAVCEELRARGHDHVGIVYNFHHAHDRMEDWEASLEMLKSYLLCLNLNGMIPEGDKVGKKILEIGKGDAEAEMIRTIVASGYEGPIGILDHMNETDSKETLEENLAGLEEILLGDEASGE